MRARTYQAHVKRTIADDGGHCSFDPPPAHSVPFHKLSQWLTYSLMEPFQKILGCEIEGVEQMTGEFESRFRVLLC